MPNNFNLIMFLTLVISLLVASTVKADAPRLTPPSPELLNPMENSLFRYDNHDERSGTTVDFTGAWHFFMYESCRVTDPNNNVFNCNDVPGMSMDFNNGEIKWNINFQQAGVWQFEVNAFCTATGEQNVDYDGVTNPLRFNVNVQNFNRLPVLADIGDQSVDEESNWNFDIDDVNDQTPESDSDVDIDGEVLTYSLVSAPDGFTIDASTGRMSWTPTSAQIGSHNIIISAIDGSGGSDDQSFTIVVNDINLAPILAGSLPPTYETIVHGMDENQTYEVDFQDYVTKSNSPDLDRDGEVISYECYIDHSEDGSNLDEIVSDAFACTGFRPGLRFDNATGVFSFESDNFDQGKYEIKIIATDSSEAKLSDELIWELHIANVNFAPELVAIGNQNVKEGSTLDLTVQDMHPPQTYLDRDLEQITFSCFYDSDIDGSVPQDKSCAEFGATMNPNTGEFSYTPVPQAPSPLELRFVATDPEGAIDDEVIVLRTEAVNLAPTLGDIADININEGQAHTLVLNSNDPNGDLLAIECEVSQNGSVVGSCEQLFSAVVDDQDQSIIFQPDYSSAGIYQIEVTVSDEEPLSASSSFELRVNDVNRAPELLALADLPMAQEGSTISVQPMFSDPDSGDSVTVSCLINGVACDDNSAPLGITYSSSTGLLQWSINFDQGSVAGTNYEVSMTVEDQGGLSDSDSFMITVFHVNRPPIINPLLEDGMVDEGNFYTQSLTVMDPDGDVLSFGCSVRDQNSESFDCNSFPNMAFSGGTLDFSPDFTQGPDVLTITMTANDGPSFMSDEMVIIVNDQNQVPILQFIADQDVDEGKTLFMDNNFLGFDPDGDPLTWTCDFGCNVPNLTFYENGNIQFDPDHTQAGIYMIGMSISDGRASASRTFSINVKHINQSPYMASITPKYISEEGSVNYQVPANDPDNDALIYSCSGDACDRPEFSLDANSGLITFNATYESEGFYMFIIRATDPEGAYAEGALNLFVSNVNRAPDFNPALANQTVDENAELSYTITAVDPDGEQISYSSPNLPEGANLDANSGILTWTPSYEAAANSPYTVTILASDNNSSSLSASGEIQITVNNVNRAPELLAIGPQSVDENSSMQFTILANDPDQDNLVFSASNLPEGSSFDVQTQIFTWQPSYEQAGSYEITFSVSDDSQPSLSDQETVVVTVNDINRAPSLAAIGGQAVDEGNLLSFNISATDPDGHNLSYSAMDLPAGANFDAGTQSFTWTPGFNQAGSYSVTFKVEDDGTPALSHTETVKISVNDINQAPVLAAIGDKSVDENSALSFKVSASDPDAGDALAYTASNLPRGASFDPISMNFSWTPSFEQAGSYQVTFSVSDNGAPILSASETITITVNNINRAPVLASIGNKMVDENSTLNFTLSASDADVDSLTYTASELPAGASFDAESLQFSWTPGYDQAGNYNVTFTVSDGGSPVMSDSDVVSIKVNNVNRAPELAAIGAQTVDEGQQIQFSISASDADGDSLIYSASGLPTGASFDADSQTFTWTPNFNQTGNYSITFQVSDSGTPALSDSETVTIDVGNVNRSPELAAIGNKTGDENSSIEFSISATDPDGDNISYSASGLPEGASFSGSTFSWNTDYDSAGSYSITFTAVDSGNPNLTDSETIQLVINNVNRAPELAAIGAKSGDENQLLEFSVSANDADGDSLSYAASGLPAGASFADGRFSWTPGFDSAGSYNVTISVTDNGNPALSDEEVVVITINNINQAPILAAIGDQSVDEGKSLSLNLSATDADGDNLSYSAANLPVGASLSGNSFSFNPDYTQSGTYSVTLTVTDSGSPALSDDETIIITVNEINQAPVLADIGAKQVNENELLEFSISASDADAGDALVYSASNLPIGASFDANTKLFSFKPSFSQAGSFEVTFTVSDNGQPAMSDSEVVIISVNNINRAPELAAIGEKSGSENSLLEFSLSASDADGDSLVYSAAGLPSGAVFNVASQTFSWTPSFEQAGSYQVTFSVDDNGTPVLSDSETINIVIAEVNRAPELAMIGNQSVNEGMLLSFTVSASDLDGNNLTYSASGLPQGANFDANSRSFTWTPSYEQAGSYDVTFSVSDDGSPSLSDSETISILVGNINQAPVLAEIGNKSGDENSSIQFSISATDADGDNLTYSAANLPAGASFSGNTFSWNTTAEDAGNYSITFIVTDSGNPNLTDTETITLSINNVNRAPVLAAIGSKSVGEGESLSFQISATDPDANLINYSALNLPVGASFDPISQMFSFTPSYDQAGVYSVTFQASDNGIPSLMDDETISITVNDTNRAPVLAAIGSQSVNENSPLSITLSATDADGDNLSYSASGLPAGASLNGNILNFTPGFDQAGSYSITFSVSDDGTPSLSDSEVVSLTVNNVNRAPQFAAGFPADQSVAEGQSLSYQLQASDADGNNISYSASGLPSGASLSASGLLSYSPDFNSARSYPIAITISDDNNPAATAEASMNIIVTEVNRAPELAAIGAKSVNESSELSFSLSATDADGNNLSYSAQGLPEGASLSGNNFSFTPSFDQAGSYEVTFSVSDDGSPSLSDSEVVMITVNNVNRAPQFAQGFPADQSIAEGQTLSYQLEGSDADGDQISYSATGLPEGASLSASGLLSYTPDADAAGSYSITVTISDNYNPAASNEESMTIVVSNVNRAPELAAIGAQSVDENSELSFSLSATDADGNNLTYSASGLPEGAILEGSNFSFTPSFDQAGSYEITFSVSDDGSPSLSDSEVVIITVNDINRAPILGSIGNQVVDEGVLLSFAISASDLDGDSLVYSASGLPQGANFDPNSLSFTWTPGHNQSGSYEVTFSVVDNGSPALSASEVVTINVMDINRAPVLAAIGAQSVEENSELRFSISASDVDGDNLTYSASGLPQGASFSGNSFSFTPSFDQAGSYEVTFSVSDDGRPSLSDSEVVIITVNNLNRAPELAAIGAQSVDENAELSLTLSATDADGNNLSYSAQGLPEGASLNGNSFSFTPSYDQAGSYEITFSVSDDGSPSLSDSEVVIITVNNINRAPQFAEGFPADQAVGEGQSISYQLQGSDADGDNVSFSAVGLPAGASLSASGLLSYNPGPEAAGSYAVTITISDDHNPSASSEVSMNIVVSDVNRAPELAAIGAKSVNENGELAFSISATDADGDSLTYSASGLPQGASFSGNSFSFTPGYDQAGSYEVTFSVSDDGSPSMSDSEVVIITVNNVNIAPEFAAGFPADQTVAEGQSLSYQLEGSDADGNSVSYSASGLPEGSSLSASGLLSFSPGYDAAGSYAITITISDDQTPAASSEASMNIIVSDVNRAPVLASIGAQSVDENKLLSFSLSATDADGNSLTYSASGLPQGASFSGNSFSFTPSYDQAGSYEVTFSVSDNGSPALSDSEVVIITVNNINRAPELASIGAQSVDENASLSFNISATDADGDNLTYSASGLPEGASFSGNSFSFTPSYDQAGSYEVTFSVSDDGTPSKSDSEVVIITVNNINRAPQFAAGFPADQSVDEGQSLSYQLQGSDADGNSVSYSASGLPEGASLSASGLLSFSPGYDAAGSYAITITISDDQSPAASSEASMNIIVSDVNRAPVLAEIGAQSVDENKLLSFSLSATDADGNSLTYSASGLPAGASLSGNSFSFTPGYDQAGSYEVTFSVSDNGSPALSDSEVVIITVNNINRAPELASIGAQSVNENAELAFSISGSDADGNNLTYSASGLPEGASFSGNSFSFTPSYDQAGSYEVTFSVSDDGVPVKSDSEVVIITVNNVNRAPQFAAGFPADQSVDEGQSISYQLQGSDADGDNVSYSASGLPEGASLSASGLLSYSAGYDAAGSYEVIITISDDQSPAMTAQASMNIIVNNINRAPELATIGAQSVDENAELSFSLTAIDADRDNISFSATGLPQGASFDGSRFRFTPSYDQAGTYEVTFSVTDAGSPSLSDSEVVIITVNNVNRAPELAAIGAQSVNENVNLSFSLSATDADGDNLTYSASGLPQGASLTGNNFSFTPGFDQAGSYEVTFSVSDNGSPSLSDSEVVLITVNNMNQAPQFAAGFPSDQSVDEGKSLSYQLQASDADGDNISYSATGLPQGANLSASGLLSYSAGYEAAGTYDVVITISDDQSPAMTAQASMKIIVNEGNRMPRFGVVGDQSVDENVLLSFVVNATDRDGNNLTYSAAGLPQGANFDPNSRSFTWTPSYDQAGSYEVTFTVTDDGNPALSDTQVVSISVNDMNRAPVLASIGPKTVSENTNLSFSLSASDADGNPLTYSAIGLPQGASLNGSSFSFKPSYEQAGTYEITFKVSDNGSPSLSDEEVVRITVDNVNRAPEFAAGYPSAQTVNEGGSLSYQIEGSDVDGNNISYSATGLPQGASLSSSGLLSFSPGYDQAGSYTIVVTITDDQSPSMNDQASMTIQVIDVNRAPVMAAISNQSINEGASLQLQVSATDVDGDSLVYSASGLPQGASFNAANQTLSWTPGYTQAGVYNIQISVSDSGSPSMSDSKSVQITVADVSAAPIIAGIQNPYSVDQGQSVVVNFSVINPSGINAPISVSLQNAPIGAVLSAGIDVINGAGSYTITYSAAAVQGQSASSASFNILATNGVENSSQNVIINTNAYQGVQIADIADLVMGEGETQIVNVVSTSSDPSNITINAMGRKSPYFWGWNAVDPSFMSFQDLGNGFAQFTFNPTAVDSGTYIITVTASDGYSSDTESFTLTVRDSNQPPMILGEVPPVNGIEMSTMSAMIFGYDADGDSLTYTIQNSWLVPWCTITQLGSQGVVTCNPGYDVATLGTPAMYPLHVRVSDGQEYVDTIIELNVENLNRKPFALTQYSMATSIEEAGDYGIAYEFYGDDLDNYDPELSYSCRAAYNNLEMDCHEVPGATVANGMGKYVFAFAPAIDFVDEDTNLTLTFKGTDNAGDSYEEIVVISVIDKKINTPPSLQLSQSMVELLMNQVSSGMVLFSFTGSDMDEDDSISHQCSYRNLPDGEFAACENLDQIQLNTISNSSNDFSVEVQASNLLTQPNKHWEFKIELVQNGSVALSQIAQVHVDPAPFSFIADKMEGKNAINDIVYVKQDGPLGPKGSFYLATEDGVYFSQDNSSFNKVIPANRVKAVEIGGNVLYATGAGGSRYYKYDGSRYGSMVNASIPYAGVTTNLHYVVENGVGMLYGSQCGYETGSSNCNPQGYSIMKHQVGTDVISFESVSGNPRPHEIYRSVSTKTTYIVSWAGIHYKQDSETNWNLANAAGTSSMNYLSSLEVIETKNSEGVPVDVIIAGGRQLYASIDGGKNFEVIQGLEIYDIHKDLEAGKVYIGTKKGLGSFDIDPTLLNATVTSGPMPASIGPSTVLSNFALTPDATFNSDHVIAVDSFTSSSSHQILAGGQAGLASSINGSGFSRIFYESSHQQGHVVEMLSIYKKTLFIPSGHGLTVVRNTDNFAADQANNITVLDAKNLLPGRIRQAEYSKHRERIIVLMDGMMYYSDKISEANLQSESHLKELKFTRMNHSSGDGYQYNIQGSRAFAVSADGKYIFISLAYGKYVLYNAAAEWSYLTGEINLSASSSSWNNRFMRLKYSDDGSLVGIHSSESHLVKLFIATVAGEDSAVMPIEKNVVDFDLNSSGHILYSTNNSSSSALKIINGANRQLINSYPLTDNGLNATTYSRNYVSLSNSGTINVTSGFKGLFRLEAGSTQWKNYTYRDTGLASQSFYSVEAEDGSFYMGTYNGFLKGQ